MNCNSSPRILGIERRYLKIGEVFFGLRKMTEHWFKAGPLLGIQIVEGRVVTDEEGENIPAGMTVQINYYLQDAHFARIRILPIKMSVGTE